MSTDLVDITRLEELTDSDPQEMKSLLDLYFQETDKHLRDLKAAIEEKSSEKVGRISHTCCGASLVCGITSVAAPLRQMEMDAKSNDLTRASEHLTLAQTKLEAVRTYFLDSLKS